MISFDKKFYFLKVHEYWFSSDIRIQDMFSLSAYLNTKNLKKKWIFSIKNISYSVENSLQNEMDVIFSDFSSTVRTDIRNAEKKGIKCYFHSDIESFVAFYNNFAELKNIPYTSRQRIMEMNGKLVMSYAFLGGEILAAHSYLTDEEMGIVLLFHSASRRFDNNIDTKIIGTSNKLLHYKDMMHFKSQGFKIYDFGGYAENTKNESLAGINKFKLSFGGKKVNSVNYYSIGYILFHWFAKFFKIIK